MTISKAMMTKIAEKTQDNNAQRSFIVSILEEENKGIGWYKEKYKQELKNAVEEEDRCGLQK